MVRIVNKYFVYIRKVWHREAGDTEHHSANSTALVDWCARSFVASICEHLFEKSERAAAPTKEERDRTAEEDEGE